MKAASRVLDNTKSVYFFITVFLLSFTIIEPCFSQPDNIDEVALENALINNDIIYFDKLFNSGFNANFQFTKSKYTLLQKAIIHNQPGLVNLFLINGADPNLKNRNGLPLLMAIKQSNDAILVKLLQYGADSAFNKSSGYKYLEVASKKGNLSMCINLIRAGAFPGDSKTLDLVRHLKDIAGSEETLDYFNNLYYLFLKYPEVKDITDGPYIKCISDDFCEVTHFFRNYKSKKNRLYRQNENCNQAVRSILNLQDNFIHSYNELCQPESSTHFFTEEPILALGDFHGDYRNLVYFLVSNEIIDKNHNWSWGKGNLVITGDIFDRGDQVTECLWLLIRLQHQAEQNGGKVFFLLGNHEIMTLNGNTSYLSDKYTFMSEYYNIKYKDLFGTESIFGKWLRSRNSVIKINNIMFLHAGISEIVFQKRLEIDSINVIIRESVKKQKYSEFTDIERLILGIDGPLWYRGYMGGYGYSSEPIAQEIVDQILDFYKAKAMVIAHSTIENISVTYGGKVFGIDVLMVNDGKSIPQGLLIKNNKYYRLYPNGVSYLLSE